MISVSVGDTLELEPTHICEKDPAELVLKFVEELERRERQIREKVLRAYMPEDVKMIPKKERDKIEEWCNEVLVVGFNSGSYDLNLIREHFAERLAGTTAKVRVVKTGTRSCSCSPTTFVSSTSSTTSAPPGTSYEKWAKADECEAEKSWFPYEWFDSPEKLDFQGLPRLPGVVFKAER